MAWVAIWSALIVVFSNLTVAWVHLAEMEEALAAEDLIHQLEGFQIGPCQIMDAETLIQNFQE